MYRPQKMTCEDVISIRSASDFVEEQREAAKDKNGGLNMRKFGYQTGFRSKRDVGKVKLCTVTKTLDTCPFTSKRSEECGGLKS